MTIDCKQLASAMLLATVSAMAGAQTPMPAASGAKESKTPATMPPGAKSTMGNKAATPASGPASSGTDMPPGAKSSKGDKAMTPKSQGKPASGAM